MRRSLQGVINAVRGVKPVQACWDGVRYCLLVGSVLLVAGCGQARMSDFVLESTKSELDQYRQELQAAEECGQQGNAAGMQEHQARAQSHLREAADLFERANAGESENLEVLKTYAGALRLSQDWDLEANVWERAATLAPEDAEVWLGLGKARARLGSESQKGAEEALRRALECDASSSLRAAVCAQLGELYREEGLYDLAREELTKALEGDSGLAAASIGLAGLDVRDGKVREAVQRIDSLGQAVQQETNLLQRVMGESVHDFEAYRRWFPDEAANHLAYAKVLVWANRLPDCVMPLQRAAELDPDNTVTWNFLGSILRQLGQNDQAREAFEKSLAINPDQPHTREVLQELGSAAAEEDSSGASEGKTEEASDSSAGEAP